MNLNRCANWKMRTTLLFKRRTRVTLLLFFIKTYLKSVETLLKDYSKFKSVPIAPDKDLNYIINSEKRVTDLLKKLKNKNVISDETYNKLKPVDSKPGNFMDQLKSTNPL